VLFLSVKVNKLPWSGLQLFRGGFAEFAGLFAVQRSGTDPFGFRGGRGLVKTRRRVARGEEVAALVMVIGRFGVGAPGEAARPKRRRLLLQSPGIREDKFGRFQSDRERRDSQGGRAP